ncbi:polymerase [Octopus vulgaris]|uniref:Polymerase n=1 Tax=Octopus vulgaris TaxID=6645 RepID=A0AA36BS79_OCTVU|nr:polymerase [Octopus vulgaris]
MSTLYSEKSFSMTKTEGIEFIKNKPNQPIPTKKVLTKALTKNQLNVHEFLAKIEREGISEDHLIIGLKPKERELKLELR